MFTPARPPEPPKECPVVTDLPAYTAEQSEQYRKKAIRKQLRSYEEMLTKGRAIMTEVPFPTLLDISISPL